MSSNLVPRIAAMQQPEMAPLIVCSPPLPIHFTMHTATRYTSPMYHDTPAMLIQPLTNTAAAAPGKWATVVQHTLCILQAIMHKRLQLLHTRTDLLLSSTTAGTTRPGLHSTRLHLASFRLIGRSVYFRIVSTALPRDDAMPTTAHSSFLCRNLGWGWHARDLLS
jgi:hypothetical protein